MKLVLIIVEKTPSNVNKLHTYILTKKNNLLSKKLNSNMLIKWTNMWNKINLNIFINLNVWIFKLAAKIFLPKFHQFTNQKFQVTIKWSTKKVKSLVSLNDKNPYQICLVYKGTCICNEMFNGKTIRNVNIRWKEDVDIGK